MAVTVHDLLQAQHLGLELLGGGTGLENTVEWAHTCDLPDPWNWVGRDHVLLTNGQSLPSDPEGQVQFLERLHQADVAAVGVGAGMSAAQFCPPALERADELAMPLLSIPFPLPFAAISQMIAHAMSAENARRVQVTARLYGLLRTAGTIPLLDQRFLDAVSDLLGYDTVLVDARCLHHWMPEADDLPAWMSGARPLSARAADGMAALWKNEGQELLQALPVPALKDCMAVFRPRPGAAQDADLLLHAVSVIGTVAGRHHLDAVQRNREAVEYVDRILNEGNQLAGAPALWLAELGYERSTMVRGAVLSGGTPAQRDSLVHRLQRHGLSLAASMRSDRLMVFLREDGRRSEGDLMGLLRHAHADGIRVGVGSAMPASEVLSSLKEAIWALELAQPIPTGAGISEGSAQGAPPVAAGQPVAADPSFPSIALFDPARSWMGFQSPQQGQALMEAILGPLLEGPAGRRDLLLTLEAYLEQERSPQRTSEALHLHRQTVNQRLRKIESLLGTELRRTDTVAQLWIALRLYRATGRPEIG